MIARGLLLTFFLAVLFSIVLSVNESSPAADDPAPPTGADPLDGVGLALELDRTQRELRHLEQRYAARGRVIRRQRANLRASIHGRPWGNHWLERAFLCIHREEGAWHSSTGNGYYGGLQMDRQFMRSYGPEFLRELGPANRWPAAVQIAVAVRAYLSGRGFGPWPNTARECGLR